MQRADVAFLAYVCSPSLIPKGDELMHDQAKASHYRVFSLNKFTFSGLVFPIIALCVCTLVRYVTKKYVVFLRIGDFIIFKSSVHFDAKDLFSLFSAHSG